MQTESQNGPSLNGAFEDTLSNAQQQDQGGGEQRNASQRKADYHHGIYGFFIVDERAHHRCPPRPTDFALSPNSPAEIPLSYLPSMLRRDAIWKAPQASAAPPIRPQPSVKGRDVRQILGKASSHELFLKEHARSLAARSGNGSDADRPHPALCQASPDRSPT